MNTGDSVFVWISTLLVFLMIPGLAFFYAGLVRKKNILSVLMACFATLAIVSLQWVLFGYSLAFDPAEFIHGFLGGFHWVGLSGVLHTPFPGYSATIPHSSYMMFQMMFAVITPALIIGAVVERMKFSALCVFILAWSFLVYDPIAHWVWGMGGWLRQLGALDFAGGTVVHISAGISALAVVLILGKRKELATAHPCNLPMVVLGAGLLWLGWFGFNAGSALAMSDIAMQAFLTTHSAAAAATLSYLLLEWGFQKRPTILGAVTGAIAGLVAVTPAAGFVSIFAAIFVGAVASLVAYFMITVVKKKLGYDDALDVFGVHGMCGIWGALATGIFASTQINPGGAEGLLYGNLGLFKAQVIAVIVSVGYSFCVTFVLIKVIDAIMGIRVTEQEEYQGLDLSLHHEIAYKLD